MKRKIIIFYLFAVVGILMSVSCNNNVQSIDETPPQEVSKFTATAMDSKVMLLWEEPNDADFSGVEITYISTTVTPPPIQTYSIILNKGNTSFTVHGLENSTEYTFTIKTFDETGNVSEGVSISATTKSKVSGIAIAYPEQSDIGKLEYIISDGTITFTAPSDYNTYKWRLDDSFLDSGETPNEVKITISELSNGVHSVIVIVDGMYSSNCTITVKDGLGLSDFSEIEIVEEE